MTSLDLFFKETTLHALTSWGDEKPAIGKYLGLAGKGFPI